MNIALIILIISLIVLVAGIGILIYWVARHRGEYSHWSFIVSLVVIGIAVAMMVIALIIWFMRRNKNVKAESSNNGWGLTL